MGNAPSFTLGGKSIVPFKYAFSTHGHNLSAAYRLCHYDMHLRCMGTASNFNISPPTITNATANEPIFSADLQMISRQYLFYLFLHNSLLNIVNRAIVGNISCVIEINLAVIHVVPFAVVFAQGL